MGYAFTEVDPSDYYTALTTYYTPDFSSVAKFIILDGDKGVGTQTTGQELNLDLLIQNVAASFGEHNHILPYIGDYFGIHYYGKAPLFVQITGTLVDSTTNYNKSYLISLYKNTLRLKAVAKTKICPCLVLPGMSLQGPLLSMTVSESSEAQDTVHLAFKMLVLRLFAFSSGSFSASQALYDFTGQSVITEDILKTVPADADFAIVSNGSGRNTEVI